MISLGSIIRLSDGNVGRIIRIFDCYLGIFGESLVCIRMDAPDRFGASLTTAWESECKEIQQESEIR
jgi:hypothetical protein